MPLYKNWGVALFVIILTMFFYNWAAFGGDPFSLVYFEFVMTMVWIAARIVWHVVEMLERKGVLRGPRA